MKKNDILAVLIKKTPRGDSPDPKIVSYFHKMFKTKDFLDYISRLSANISLDSETLHKSEIQNLIKALQILRSLFRIFWMNKLQIQINLNQNFFRL